MKRPVALLWHMHQPAYRLRGETSTFHPWVRLHSIRSYYDMIGVLDEFPAVRCTMNLVPILVEQIRAYENGASDHFWDIARMPSKDLGPTERKFMFDHFFSAHPEQMIRPFPRYADLLERRNRLRQSHPSDGWKRLTKDDYLDLKVLFDLSWFGFKAREEFPLLTRLAEKGFDFSDDDARAVAEIELQIVRGLLQKYRNGAERRQIEISCSPYAHPILPLLVTTDSAREAMPHAPLPPTLSFPEDARRQINDALAYMEQELGRRPSGMWPSEGSVSDDILRITAECGLSWVATDEEILHRSKTEIPADPHFSWISSKYGDRPAILFRDHELSDRIGFTYAKMNAAEAAKDFFATARSRLPAGKKPALTLAALDGENPWQAYPRSGADFLRQLYRAGSDHPDLELTTVTEALERTPTRPKIERLHAGSWIGGNFAIWIGGPEKNRLWQMLSRVRSELALAMQAPQTAEEDRKVAWNSLRAAEGSDWFWWLDHQFESLYVAQFEETVRGHLRQAYEALHLTPPQDLDFPVIAAEHREESRVAVRPFGRISPKIDGFEADFFEWHGSTRIPWSSLWATSTMRRARDPVRDVVIGFSDRGVFFLRLDAALEAGPLPFRGLHLSLSVQTAQETRILEVRLDAKGGVESVEGVRDFAPVVAAHKLFEMSIPYAEIGLAPGETVTLKLAVQTSQGEGKSRPISLFVPTFSAPRITEISA